MVEELDYKRKKEIVEYIKKNSELLIKESKGIYKDNPSELKNVLIQAQTGLFWRDDWESSTILTELLKNYINALTSKIIYDLFEIWNGKISLECIQKTFEFICGVFPEYSQKNQSKDVQAKDLQSKRAIENRDLLIKEKYHKTTVIKKIVDVFLDRNKKGIYRCKADSCELKTPTIDFGKSVRSFDKYTLETALLIDGLEYLRQLLSLLIKDNKKFTKNAKELKVLSSGIITFYFNLDKILFSKESADPTKIDIETINKNVKDLLRKRLEESLVFDWAETLMDKICNFELRYRSNSTSKSKNNQNDDVENSIPELVVLYPHIGELQEKLIQETLNRTEISCIGLNAKIEEMPNEPPIPIVEWVKQRPVFSKVEVV